jgi:Ca-activated chloride channel family protein
VGGSAVTFQRPELLQALPPVAVLLVAGILWQWRRSVRLADAFGGRGPARRLTGRALRRLPAARLACVLVAVAALILAASGAREDTGEPPPPPTPVDLIVALDVSHSMTGSDVEPSRFERAREVVAEVVEARVADRVGLTLFAGWPYRLVPMTDDAMVVDYFVPAIEPGLVASRDQGTALAAVVRNAVDGWRDRARDDAVPVLLVVSDGEAQGAEADVLDAVDAAVDAGLRIWTVGVGTVEGAPLTVAGSGGAPLLDGTGGRVVAGYDPDLLRDMARIGGGGFHELSSGGDVDRLLDELRALGGEAEDAKTEPFDPTLILLLTALSLLAADAVLDSGTWTRGRARGLVEGRSA